MWDFFSKVSGYLFGASIPSTTDAGAFFAAYFANPEEAMKNKPGWFQRDGLIHQAFQAITDMLGGANTFFAKLWNGEDITDTQNTLTEFKDTLDKTFFSGATPPANPISEAVQVAAVGKMKDAIDRSYGAGAKWAAANYATIGENAHNSAEKSVEEAVFRTMLTEAGFSRMEDVDYQELKAQYEHDANLKSLFEFAEAMGAKSADKLQTSLTGKDKGLLTFDGTEAAALATQYSAAKTSAIAFGNNVVTPLQEAITRVKGNKGLKAIGDIDLGRTAMANAAATNAAGAELNELQDSELDTLNALHANITKALKENGTAHETIKGIMQNLKDIDIHDAGTGHYRLVFQSKAGKEQELFVAR